MSPHHTFWKPERGTALRELRDRRKFAKREADYLSHQDRLEQIAFWRELRADLYARDGGCCRACGAPVDLDAGLARNAAHAHHLRHRSLGGSDTLENLVLLDAPCHRAHHDGRLSISGTVECLEFTLRTLKGQTVKVWQGVNL